MFIGKIEKIEDCKELGEDNIALIKEFLKNNDLKSLEVGKYPLNENSRVLIQEYTTKQPNGRFEAHRKYADVQVVVSGEETFGIADKEDCRASELYNDIKDVEFFTGSGKDVVLSPQNGADCAVFMPGELHSPGLCVVTPAAVRKAVFKILISE